MREEGTKGTQGTQATQGTGASAAVSPFERARAVYADGRSARSFEWDLMLHLERGFVFSTPEYFVMGRPVNSRAAVADILNPAVNWGRGECDCWHVWLCVCNSGGLARIKELVPWPLNWVSFERDGELKLWVLEQAMRATEIQWADHGLAARATSQTHGLAARATTNERTQKHE